MKKYTLSKPIRFAKPYRFVPAALYFILNSYTAFAQDEPKLWQPYYITPRTGNQHIDVEKDWQLGYTDAAFQSVDSINIIKNWINVAEPTTVQMALYKANKFPHPYHNLNAKLYEWVDKKVWYYKKQISLDATLLKDKNVFLCFDGLDYFAKIWLNGQLLGNHEGMFGGPAIEVSKLLQTDKANEIIVEIRSGNYGIWEKFEYRRPGRIIKSIDQAGGEGSKPFFALGMWRKARLEIVPAIHLERPFITAKQVENNKAILSFESEVFVRKHSLNYNLHPWNNLILSRGTYPAEVISAPEKLQINITFTDSDKKIINKIIPLNVIEGRNWVKQDIVIDNPQIWMPIGMGNPNRYKVDITLVNGKDILDKITFQYGIRTIETVPTAGRQTTERWDDLQFVVNKKRLFVKGMNWMPVDALLDLQPEKYRWLLGMAKEAGIQMVRVWGGGLMETDDFYDICDSLGIMVWQDFTVWHQDTPERPQDIWEAQVVQNIFRLRNHASLTVYCGGNGFNPYSFGSVATSGIMERSLKDFDPTRPFFRTSSDAGNIHTYPDIDPARYAHLYQYVPFISESGIHSIPDANSLKEVISSNEFNDLGKIYDADFPKNHPEIISHFVEYSADRVPRMVSRASHIDNMQSPTIESLSEAAQIGAGEFYQLMSEGAQSNYPATAGLMPWVFKRPWPVFSAIMLVDGFGHPVAPYYFLKRTYEPTHISLTLPNLMWAVGEKIPIKTALLHHAKAMNEATNVSVVIYADDFKKVWEKSQIINSITAGPVVLKDSLGAFTIPTEFRDKYFFAVAELKKADGKVMSRSVYWLRCLSALEDAATLATLRQEPASYATLKPAWLSLDKGPWLKPTVGKTATMLSLEIVTNKSITKNESELKLKVKNTGKTPAFMTKIDITGLKRAFYASDNYLWLQPNEIKEITMNVLWREEKGSSMITVSAWNAAIIQTKLQINQ